MRRLGVILAVVCGCASTEHTPEPVATTPPPTMPKPADESGAASAAEVEAEALRCDGPALMTRGASALLTLDPDASPPSASLLAAWERVRAFDGDGNIEAASVEHMLPRFADALGMAPPRWWVDTLKSARGGRGVTTGFNLGITDTGDRRGPLEQGPGGIRVRSGLPLAESGGMLAYDLSMGRVQLGPLPSGPGTAIEVTRARAGSTLYVGTFDPGAGGFRFPVRAVGSDGKERWTTEACAADRKALGGRGYMIVQMIVLEDPPAKPGVMAHSNPRGLVVFTAETHGVTVEVFELETGTRTLAWSSDLWSWRG